MKVRLLLVLLAAMICTACGGPGQLVELSPTQTRVRMTAENFSFDPPQIVAPVGATLVLEIHSTSRFDHNVTVEDPEGRIILSEALLAGATVEIEVPLTRRGVYPFYCHQTMHSPLGMKGRIEAR